MHQLKKFNVFVLFGLSIVTLGLYLPFWALNTRKAFVGTPEERRLNPNLFYTYLGVGVISFTLNVFSFVYTNAIIEILISLILFVEVGLYLGVLFLFRDILLKYAKGSNIELSISSLVVFFFGPLEIQSAINRLLRKEAEMAISSDQSDQSNEG